MASRRCVSPQQGTSRATATLDGAGSCFSQWWPSLTEQELQRREALIELRMADKRLRDKAIADALAARHEKQRANAAYQRMLSQIVVGAV